MFPVSTRDTGYKRILKVMGVPDVTDVTFPDRGTAVLSVSCGQENATTS